MGRGSKVPEAAEETSAKKGIETLHSPCPWDGDRVTCRKFGGTERKDYDG